MTGVTGARGSRGTASKSRRVPYPEGPVGPGEMWRDGTRVGVKRRGVGHTPLPKTHRPPDDTGGQGPLHFSVLALDDWTAPRSTKRTPLPTQASGHEDARAVVGPGFGRRGKCTGVEGGLEDVASVRVSKEVWKT